MLKARTWLKKNKIFFETITATSLTIMAVIISSIQINISNKQTKLLNIQTEINKKNYQRILDEEKIRNTANWEELKNAMWEIINLYPPNIESLNKLPTEEKIKWKNKMFKLLISQTDNPVLLKNKECLGYWRSAISTAKVWNSITDKIIDKRIEIEAESIIKDIMFVWSKLILNSNEISATGGRPNKSNYLE